MVEQKRTWGCSDNTAAVMSTQQQNKQLEKESFVLQLQTNFIWW